MLSGLRYSNAKKDAAKRSKYSSNSGHSSGHLSKDLNNANTSYARLGPKPSALQKNESKDAPRVFLINKPVIKSRSISPSVSSDEHFSSVDNSEYAKNGTQKVQSGEETGRDQWMLGDFDLILGPAGARERRKRERAAREAGEAIVKSRELNPFYANGGVGIPISKEPQTDKLHSETSEISKSLSVGVVSIEDCLVGDGGKSWRKKSLLRQRQDERGRSPIKKFTSTNDYGNRQLGLSKLRHWKTSRLCEKKTNKHLERSYEDNSNISHPYEDTYADSAHNLPPFDIKEEHQLRTDSVNSIPSPTVSTHSDPGTCVEDDNFLTSQALKCLMAGDQKGYEFYENKKHHIISNEINSASSNTNPRNNLRKDIVFTLEDIDSKGRSISVINQLEKNTNKTNEQQSSLSRSKTQYKRHDPDEHTSLQDLYRAVRIKGVDDFDEQYKHSILKYREIHEDDEETHSLIQWNTAYDSKKSPKVINRQSRINDTNALHKVQTKCLFCPQSSTFVSARKQTVIAMSHHAYLSYQSFKQCIVQFHLFISPIMHIASSPELDENVYQDIRNFQKALIKFLDNQDIAVIFVEHMAKKVSMEKALLGGGSHLVIDCYGVPIDRLGEAKAYFKKALNETSGDWTHHQKVIVVPQRKDGCRSAIPKNFPYFYVDFSLNGGMLQVIEEDDFSRHFGREVIQGIMELDRIETHFRSREEYYLAIESFKKQFAPYDWTRSLIS